MKEQEFATCTCNVCSQRIEFPRTHTGESINCPHCKAFTLLFIPPVKRKASMIRKTESGFKGGIEEILSGWAAVFFALSGILLVVTMIAFAVPMNGELSGFYAIAGIAGSVAGIITSIILNTIAEIVRIQKKANGLPYSGKISEAKPAIKTSPVCSLCRVTVTEHMSSCPACSAEFQ